MMSVSSLFYLFSFRNLDLRLFVSIFVLLFCFIFLFFKRKGVGRVEFNYWKEEGGMLEGGWDVNMEGWRKDGMVWCGCKRRGEERLFRVLGGGLEN